MRKSTNLATIPFSDFAINATNAEGKLEFLFLVTDKAAFFRVQAQ